MAKLHHMASTFLIYAVLGAAGLLALAWIIIGGLPALTRLLDTVTGN